MSTLVLVEAKAKHEHVQDAINFIKKRFPETRAYEGCQEVTAYLNDDGHTFLYVEQWDTKELYEKYLAWRQETGVFEELVSFLEGSPDIRFFEPVDA